MISYSLCERTKLNVIWGMIIRGEIALVVIGIILCIGLFLSKRRYVTINFIRQMIGIKK